MSERCYVCGNLVGGQVFEQSHCMIGCQQPICINHGVFREGKQACLICAAGGYEKLSADVKRTLKAPAAVGPCGVCQSPVIPDWTTYASFSCLSADDQAAVAAEVAGADRLLAASRDQIGCGCLSCREHHQKEIYEAPTTDYNHGHYYHECRVCQRRGGGNYHGAGSARADSVVKLSMYLAIIVCTVLGGQLLDGNGRLAGYGAGFLIGFLAGLLTQWIVRSLYRRRK